MTRGRLPMMLRRTAATETSFKLCVARRERAEHASRERDDSHVRKQRLTNLKNKAFGSLNPLHAGAKNEVFWLSPPCSRLFFRLHHHRRSAILMRARSAVQFAASVR